MKTILLLLFVALLPAVLMNKIEFTGKSVCFHGDAANWVKGIVNIKSANQNISPGGHRGVRPAFSAQIAPDTKLKRGEIFKFSRVTMNVGKMYDPKTGIAQIPSDGNYVITWRALTDSGYSSFPYFKINNVIKGATSCVARGGSRASCGNTLIFPLKKGDKIWIEEWISNKGRIIVQSGFTSFTVWKM